MADFSTTDNSKAPKHATPQAAQGIRIDAGPFIGIIKHNVDPKRSGRLVVWIEGLGGSSDDPSSWRTVQYASPFYGVTPPPMTADGNLDKRQSGDNFETNPHSYGFWMVPPDLGTKVLCTFVQGDPEKGYWFACLPDWPNMHMVPGLSGSAANPLPLVEFNPDGVGRTELVDFESRSSRPVHKELANQLVKQGLDQDKERGLITSSAFRESPSAVFGFSTPGRSLDDQAQLDAASDPTVKTDENGENSQEASDQASAQQNAQQRGTGKGRKGGHSIVMDDGDADGMNQLIRIRSAKGNMIMMNDTSGFVYIINSTGTAWVEMDSAGAINFYSETDIKFAAKNNIYMEATNGGIKMHAKNAIDIVADATLNATGKGAVNIYSDKLTKVTGKDGLHLKGKNTYLTGDSCVQISGGQHLDLGASCINLNCAKPTPAQAASSGQAPQGMPTKEPWSGHKKGPGGRGSGTTKPLGSFGQSNAVSGNYGKAADYSGVDNNSRNSVSNGYIGSTGGSGPGSTGFRQGTESAPTNTFGGSGNVTEYRGYPNLNGQLGVGSGQCVALVAAYSDCGHVSTWRPADSRNLFDNPPQPGAAIATLDRGYYANRDTGNHAAIYLGQGQDSRGRYILVQEQNVARDAAGNKVIGERRIYERNGGSDSNNASTYRVIANDRNPNGVYVRNAPPIKQEPTNADMNQIKAPEQQGDRPDVNQKDKGYLSPEEEQKNRDQLRAEEAKGGDASAGGATPSETPTESDGSIGSARQQEAKYANDQGKIISSGSKEEVKNTPIYDSKGNIIGYNQSKSSSSYEVRELKKDVQDNNKILDDNAKKVENANQDLKDGKISQEQHDKIVSETNNSSKEANERIAESENKLNNSNQADGQPPPATNNDIPDPPPTSFDRDRDYKQEVADKGSNNPGPAETNPYANNSYDAMGNPTGIRDDYAGSSTGSNAQNTEFNAQATVNDQIGSPAGYNDIPMPSRADVGASPQQQADAAASDAGNLGSGQPVTGDKQGPGQGGVQGPAGAPQNNSPNAPSGVGSC